MATALPVLVVEPFLRIQGTFHAIAGQILGPDLSCSNTVCNGLLHHQLIFEPHMEDTDYGHRQGLVHHLILWNILRIACSSRKREGRDQRELNGND